MFDVVVEKYLIFLGPILFFLMMALFIAIEIMPTTPDSQAAAFLAKPVNEVLRIPVAYKRIKRNAKISIYLGAAWVIITLLSFYFDLALASAMLGTLLVIGLIVCVAFASLGKKGNDPRRQLTSQAFLQIEKDVFFLCDPGNPTAENFIKSKIYFSEISKIEKRFLGYSQTARSILILVPKNSEDLKCPADSFFPLIRPWVQKLYNIPLSYVISDMFVISLGDLREMLNKRLENTSSVVE